MKDKLRELAERWTVYGSHMTGHECSDELLAILDAEGDGGAVAKVRHFDYRGIARNGFSQEAEMLDAAPVLPDGTLLYTRLAPPASPAGVPDVLIHKALIIAANIRTADWLDAGGTLNEQDALRDWIAAAPSAPEGGHIDRARFEKAPCYLCGYNGPGYYQPGTHSCAAKYHATQPTGE